MPVDQYQTVQELAARLEVSEATIRQWIKSGELRAIDIGKGWRIANTDLATFLKARETAPRKPINAQPTPEWTGRDDASPSTVPPCPCRRSTKSAEQEPVHAMICRTYTGTFK